MMKLLTILFLLVGITCYSQDDSLFTKKVLDGVDLSIAKSNNDSAYFNYTIDSLQKLHQLKFTKKNGKNLFYLESIVISFDKETPYPSLIFIQEKAGNFKLKFKKGKIIFDEIAMFHRDEADYSSNINKKISFKGDNIYTNEDGDIVTYGINKSKDFISYEYTITFADQSLPFRKRSFIFEINKSTGKLNSFLYAYSEKKWEKFIIK